MRKAYRGLSGASQPFEARLDSSEHKTVWTMKDVEEVDQVRIAALLAAGMSVRDIADEIGISKSVVHRLKQRIEQEAADAAAGEARAGSTG